MYFCNVSSHLELILASTFPTSCVIIHSSFFFNHNNSNIESKECERENKFSIILVAVLNTGCPENWQTHDEFCYLVNEQATHTYEEARIECTNSGGTLASVLDQDEQDFLDGKSEPESQSHVRTNNI